jgi:hypothetical protein
MNRTLFAILLVAAPAWAAADEPKKPDYFPLAKGNKWDYEVKVGDEKREFTLEITAVKAEKGTTTAEFVVRTGEEEETGEVIADAEGVRGRFNTLKMDPPLTLLKYPLKANDRWAEKLQIQNDEVLVSSSVKEAEEVKVPAGTYKAVPVETGLLVRKDAVGITTWYAAGVGIVQIKVVAGEAEVASLRLKKFTPGK